MDCSGLIAAQADASAAIRVSRSFSGAAHGITSVSAMVQVCRGFSGTSAARATLTAVLTKVRSVPVAGPLDRRTSWRREALFNGVTSTAFKLSTALTRGWFWMRRRGCTAVYGGATPAEVHFNRVLHVVDPESKELSLPAYLSPPAGSTRYYFLRRFNGSGDQERTTAAAAVVRITADGRLEPPAPNAVLGLHGERKAGNTVRLTWFYCSLDGPILPERFNVYANGGTGQVDLDHPIAVVPFRGRKFHHCDCGVSGDGRHVFVIRPMSEDFVESELRWTVVYPAQPPPSDLVSILAVESI